MIKRLVWLIPAIIVVTLSLSGCGSNSARPVPVANAPISANLTPPFLPQGMALATPVTSPQPGSTVGSPFLPGEVLAGLPVYPGASGTTYLNLGFGPPSFPLQAPEYIGKSPGYQSASAQYTVEATDGEITGWYLTEMTAIGYQESGEDFSGGPNAASHSIAFFLPAQPLISVEVHVYGAKDVLESRVFELLVIYSVPLPKPAEEKLPDDINSIKIEYNPGAANEVKKTITDTQSTKSLVNMVNNLPLRPDYMTLGGPVGTSGPQTLFSLVFHSAAQGDIAVTDIVGEGIHLGNYPTLDDPHSLLQGAVRQLLGIP